LSSAPAVCLEHLVWYVKISCLATPDQTLSPVRESRWTRSEMPSPCVRGDDSHGASRLTKICYAPFRLAGRILPNTRFPILNRDSYSSGTGLSSRLGQDIGDEKSVVKHHQCWHITALDSPSSCCVSSTAPLSRLDKQRQRTSECPSRKSSPSQSWQNMPGLLKQLREI
jgi:hypothetical protein